MTDLRRAFVMGAPIASLLLLTAGWKLYSLPEPEPVIHVVDPVKDAETLYAKAKKCHDEDPRLARGLCDEAIAVLDSYRSTLPDPAPGNVYPFEELYQRVVALKVICR